jgi:hypothetical protein
MNKRGVDVMRTLDANATVAVYEDHLAAEEAVKELHKSGFDMKQLSVVGRDIHSEDQVVGYYNAGDRIKYWGKLGAFWGGLWGLIFGAAFFWVPGVGPILIGGPLVASIVAALEGAIFTGGLSVIGAGLYSIGIPKDSIVQYETAITTGKFLVVIHGTHEQIATAKEVLQAVKSGELHDHVLVPHAATEASRIGSELRRMKIDQD